MSKLIMSNLSDLDIEVLKMNPETFLSFCQGRLTLAIGKGDFRQGIQEVLWFERIRCKAVSEKVKVVTDHNKKKDREKRRGAKRKKT